MKEALNVDAKQNAKEKLKTLKEAYFTHRQVGIAEAVYRLIPGMYLRSSNIHCIFVITGFPKNRSIFWRKVAEDDKGEMNLDGDGSDNETEAPVVDRAKRLVRLPNKTGYYVESITIHDRYAVRPQSKDPNSFGRLETISLPQFATS